MSAPPGQDRLRSLSALDARRDTPAFDGWLDAGGAAAALATSEPVLLRVAAPLGEGTRGFGPAPREPWWLSVTREGPRVSLAPARGAREPVATSAAVARVCVETAMRACCDAAGCEREKALVRVLLELQEPVALGADGVTRWLVGEALDTPASAADPLRALASALSRRLGVPLSGASEVPTPAATTSPWTVEALSRWSVRWEGEHLVVRDHDSRGPRDAVARNRLLGGLFCVAGLAAAVLLASEVRAGATPGALLGEAGLLVLFGLAAYAFSSVAAFSARYDAPSAPALAVFGASFVTLPWVGRDGAVEERPDGRFGAAIPLEELSAVALGARGADLFAVEVTTEHGAIEVLPATDGPTAERWRESLLRLLTACAHAREGASAKQRARDRMRGGGGALVPSPRVT